MTPHEFERMGGVVTIDHPTKLPMGVSPGCRNVQFTKTGVRSRDGILKTIDLGVTQPVNGLAVLPYKGSTSASDTQIPIMFDNAGGLWIESPAGSGLVRKITSTLVTPPSAASMQATFAYNRAHIAFSDLKGSGLAFPAALDGGTLNLDPLSMHQFGETWAATTVYSVGDFVCPATANGHTYRCTTAGTSGAAQPSFPTGAGSTVSDGSVVWTESTLAVADSATGGNVCAGLHYVTVLFQNRNGYISGMGQGAIFSWTAAGGKQVSLTNLPIGPANTLRRIVCFTPAAGSSAGPIFYLPKNDSISVNGLVIPITSSVINDNTTTTLTCNFHDIYLSQSNEVTDNFRKIKIPFCNDVQFIPSFNRMVYIKPSGYPSRSYVSEPADPETVFGDTGFIDISDTDGQSIVTWREFRSTVYAFKDNATYVVNPATNTPNTWDARRAWDKVGAAGPRAVDVGKEFMIFAHKSGVYKFDGSSPGEPISKEINSLWQGINWDYGHLICICIDEDNYEIRILVPYGQSTVPNKQFLFYYGDGWQEPVTISLYGRLMAAHQGRKWSGPDDIQANLAVRAARNLSASPSAPSLTDKGFSNYQILLAASDPTGIINMVVPGTTNDNGRGFLATYDTAYGSAGAMEQGGSSSGQYQAGGAALTMKGTGQATVSLFSNGGATEYVMRPANLDPLGARDYKSGVTGAQSERFLLRVTNGADPNSSFQLNKATIYQRALFSSRAG